MIVQVPPIVVPVPNRQFSPVASSVFVGGGKAGVG
jgi:hypothetical protein